MASAAGETTATTAAAAAAGDGEGILTGDYVFPNPFTARARQSQLTTSPDGTTLLYPHPAGLIARSVENPGLGFLFTNVHGKATAAAYSPDGAYMAVGDESGTVFVLRSSDGSVLFEHKNIVGGSVTGIAFHADGKTFCAGGTNKPYMYACKTDKADKSGNFKPEKKAVLSLAVRQKDPSRVCYTTEDMDIRVYPEPPYTEPMTSSRVHMNYTNCVRYSPDGSVMVSVSSDKQIIFWNAETAEVVHTIEKAHKSSIYSCTWSLDGTQVYTASADKTVRVWDAATYECVATFTLGTEVGDMQNAVVATKAGIVSISLNCSLNFLDTADTSKPKQSLQTNDGVPCGIHASGTSVVMGSANRVVVYAPQKAGGYLPTTTLAEGFNNVKFDVCDNFVAIAGSSTEIKVADLAEGKTSDGIDVGERVTAIGVGKSGDTAVTVVGTRDKKLQVIVAGAKTAELALKFTATCVAVSADASLAFVGGDDKCLHVMKLSTDSIAEDWVGAEHRAAISSVACSSDAAMVAVGDGANDIRVYKVPEQKCFVRKLWTKHTGSISAVAFSPDDLHIASTSLDGVRLWGLKKKRHLKWLSGTVLQFAGVCWTDVNSVWAGSSTNTAMKFSI